jgi:hypothetical protein
MVPYLLQHTYASPTCLPQAQDRTWAYSKDQSFCDAELKQSQITLGCDGRLAGMSLDAIFLALGVP